MDNIDNVAGGPRKPGLSRRRLVATVYTVAAAGLAAACAPAGTGAGTEAAAKSKAPVSLRFSSWGIRDWGYEALIDKFKATHPHVTDVQIEDGGAFGDYRIKLLNQIAGDDLADVPTVGGQWYLEIAGTGALLKLDSYIQSEQKRHPDFSLPKVPAAIMEKGKIQGALYGLPYLADAGVLYVNENLFRDRGQSLPPTDWSDTRWTWDAALERARALTTPGAAGGATYGFFVNDVLICDWASMVYQRGGDVLTPDRHGYGLDRQEAYEPIQWRADLRLRHRVAPTADDVKGGATFESGRAGMTVGWSSRAQGFQVLNLPFEWNVYPLPRWQKQVSYFHNAFTPIAKRSAAPDAAWELAAYFSGPEGMSVLNPLIPKGDRPRNAALANDALKYIQPGASLYVPKWPDIQTTVNQALTREIVTGDRTARESLAAIRPAIEALVKG